MFPSMVCQIRSLATSWMKAAREARKAKQARWTFNETSYLQTERNEYEQP